MLLASDGRRPVDDLLRPDQATYGLSDRTVSGISYNIVSHGGLKSYQPLSPYTNLSYTEYSRDELSTSSSESFVSSHSMVTQKPIPTSDYEIKAHPLPTGKEASSLILKSNPLVNSSFAETSPATAPAQPLSGSESNHLDTRLVASASRARMMRQWKPRSSPIGFESGTKEKRFSASRKLFRLND